MNTHEMEALFKKRFDGTEAEKAEAIAFIRELANAPMFQTAVFVQTALRWADRMGITPPCEDFDYEPEICPCCGQQLEN